MASPAVPTISCTAVGPAVDVYLPRLFLPWIPLLGLKSWLSLPSPLLLISLLLVFLTYMASLLLLAFLLLLASLLLLVSLLLQALLFLAAYLLAKVSSAGNPVVSVALLCCSIEKFKLSAIGLLLSD